jgi:hypothetical protein
MVKPARLALRVPVLDFAEGFEFSAKTYRSALLACGAAGCAPLFMPGLIAARNSAGADDLFWKGAFTSASIRARGKTKRGRHVVVYSHMANYLGLPDNLPDCVKEEIDMPQVEFQNLADSADGKSIFVVDISERTQSKADVVTLDDALKHPQTIPFIGDKDCAVLYFHKHKEIYGNRIGLWFRNDVGVSPVARFLNLGGNGSDGLGGYPGDDCMFVGVRKSGGPDKPAPTLDKILDASGDFVAAYAKEEFERRLRDLYR